METKPGWKTTEFWGVALVDLLTIGMMIAEYLPCELGAKIVAGLTGVYAVARAIAKHNVKPQ